jgi:O-antigen ligase
VDSSTDESTAWRDLENFNLIYTIRTKPLVGVGYGHGFWEVWPLPQVDYILERFIPHNSILGIWCYGGYIGFTGLTLLWVAGVYFGIRAYHHSKAPLDKAAALVCFGTILIYYVQCFGDLGLGTFTGVFLIAPSLAIAGKLAVKSGAWTMPVPRARRAAAVAAGNVRTS